MLHTGQSGNRSFTFKRRTFEFFGDAIQIFDASGEMVGFCDPSHFQSGGEVSVYADETRRREVLRFTVEAGEGSRLRVSLPTGDFIGMIEGKPEAGSGWTLHDPLGQVVGTGMGSRRMLDERVEVADGQGTPMACMKKAAWSDGYRLRLHRTADTTHDLLVLALGCVVAAGAAKAA